VFFFKRILRAGSSPLVPPSFDLIDALLVAWWFFNNFRAERVVKIDGGWRIGRELR
jgi:hypothetical protein